MRRSSGSATKTEILIDSMLHKSSKSLGSDENGHASSNIENISRNGSTSETIETRPTKNSKTKSKDDLIARTHHSGARSQEQTPKQDSCSSPGSRPISSEDRDSDDLQFKKKEFQRSRTQSFHSVLSSASLKSLKHQFTAPSQPQLKRNTSSISQQHSRNFQSFIQAPVLSSVTNLRMEDDVEIGQQLPFDEKRADYKYGEKQCKNVVLVSLMGDGKQEKESKEEFVTGDEIRTEDHDDDIYKEETTLQQQRLTQNALKKLSLSLAPIIRSDEDDTPQSRQLTTKSLNFPHQESSLLTKPMRDSTKDLRPVLQSRKSKPYQPAEVDLSSFSSLTRQSKHGIDGAAVTEPSSNSLLKEARSKTDFQISQPSQAQVERVSHHSAQPQPLLYHFQNSLPLQKSAEILGLGPTLQKSLPRQLFSDIPRPKASEISDLGNDTYPGLGTSLSKITSTGSNLPQRKSELEKLRNIVSNPNPPSAGHISRNCIETQVGRIPFNHLHTTSLSTNAKERENCPNTRKRCPQESLHVNFLGSVKSYMSEKRLQQINGFRSPMYVPAVLRKTADEPSDSGPEAENETDYFGEAVHHPEACNKDTSSSGASIKSIDSTSSLEPRVSPGQSKTGPYEPKLHSYDHISRTAPTRRHWLKDESVIECGIDVCQKKFNFFERRHHCRKCGGIFCKDHTSHYLYINHIAQFTTGGRGTLSRVCDSCIQEYNTFMKQEFGVTCNKPLSRESLPQKLSHTKVDYQNAFSAYKISANLPVKMSESGGDPKTSDQVVGSVPANWSWSSF